MAATENAFDNKKGTTGSLPAIAPLANPYVPNQESVSPIYSGNNGWLHGTLFPGLFLPYQNNEEITSKENTMLHDMQAIRFAIQELGLYLDTHAEDEEAIALYCQYAEQAELLQQKLENCGYALTQTQSVQDGIYAWTSGSWPWELHKEG